MLGKHFFFFKSGTSPLATSLNQHGDENFKSLGTVPLCYPKGNVGSKKNRKRPGESGKRGVAGKKEKFSSLSAANVTSFHLEKENFSKLPWQGERETARKKRESKKTWWSLLINETSPGDISRQKKRDLLLSGNFFFLVRERISSFFSSMYLHQDQEI